MTYIEKNIYNDIAEKILKIMLEDKIKYDLNKEREKMKRRIDKLAQEDK